VEDLLGKYRDLYVEELSEHLDRVEELLLKLERGEGGPDALTDLMRILHTIKGNSGMMGEHLVSELAHKLEDVFGDVRDGRKRLSPELVDVALKCLDAIRVRLNGLKMKNDAGVEEVKNAVKLVESLGGSSEGSDGILDFYGVSADDVAAHVHEGWRVYDVKIRFDENHPMKQITVFMVLRILQEGGDVVKTLPEDLAMFEDSEMRALVALKDWRETLAKLREVNGIVDVEAAEVEVKAVPSGRSRVLKDLEVDALLRGIEMELEKERGVSLSSNGTQLAVSSKIEEVKVRVEDLDKLFDLVGEIMLLQSRLDAISRSYELAQLKEVAKTFRRLSRDLNDIVMRVRLIPIGQIFSLLPRMVRDLSRSMGKEIDLVIEGHEIKVDRRILEDILDPVVHLVRNAVDHGIEPPDERVKNGKLRTGVVRVAARKEGNYVVVEVEDDGRGIDLDKVKRVAIERGIVSPEIVEGMSVEEIIQLIFTPGFSTKSEVSGVSGRGIGLSSVKKMVEGLGGSVEVWTEKGRGARFSLRLPLQVATLSCVIIEAKRLFFAIPLVNVERIVNLKAFPTVRLNDSTLIRYDDSIIPVYDLGNIFGLGDTEKESGVIVVDSRGSSRAAIAVSRVLEQDEIVVKPLPSLLRGIKGLSGASILGNGDICLILDVDELLGRRS